MDEINDNWIFHPCDPPVAGYCGYYTEGDVARAFLVLDYRGVPLVMRLLLKDYFYLDNGAFIEAMGGKIHGIGDKYAGIQ